MSCQHLLGAAQHVALAVAVPLMFAFGGAVAQPLAPVGCPVFHCTPEATGVMAQPLITTTPLLLRNAGLGSMQAQGCSGDGQRLACLFVKDRATGSAAGTLKLIDATTLLPLWGSAGTAGSQDLDPATSALGQVPVIFEGGRISAGDATQQVLYDTNGRALGSVALSGTGNNLGLTPVGLGYGVVSQADGVLTLVNLGTWQAVDSLVLRDPSNLHRVALVSPSSGTSGVLYALAGDGTTGRGLVFSISINPLTHKLRKNSSFAFLGHSGASPVVVTSAVTGLAQNLVLLHTPALIDDPAPQDKLVALLDSGSSLAPLWTVPLAAPLDVSPTIDAATQTLFFIHKGDSHLYQRRITDGRAVASFDLQAITGLPSSMVLNGHLGASSGAGEFTLLLSAAVASAQDPAAVGQYELSFVPASAALRWRKKTFNTPDAYTEAWNLSPSQSGGTYCPVVVGSTSGLSRLCDF